MSPTAPTSNSALPHRRRKGVYGTAGPIDPPIPTYPASGVSEERIAELKAMTWSELVALCESLLESPVAVGSESPDIIHQR